MKSLSVERKGHVAEVALEGPGKGNAMGPDFWRELPEVFTALDRDDDLRAIVVRGSGQNFSYGLDLRAMIPELAPLLSIASGADGQQLAAGRTKLLDLIFDLQRAFDAVARCRKPVIAAVTGWCVGGGLDLIAACDVRLASSDARFSLREAKVAMVADLGSLQRLPGIIGEGATRELAFTGKDIDAVRALRIGLVSDVHGTHEALFTAAHAMAEEIAANPPLVVQGIKRVMNETSETRVAAGLRHVALWNAAFLQSNDLAEALGAFAERRTPTFTGK